MVTWVLDTSVVAKWFFEEEGTDRAERYLDELLRGVAQISVPSSLFYELSNVVWVRRARGLGEKEAAQIWAEVESLPFAITDWPDLIRSAIPFAFRHDISPYDAVFVVLARDLGAEMVTADRPMLRRLATTCSWVRGL
jgi:predicted nucleic acid-binding protein